MSEWSWINSVLIKQRGHCLTPLVYSCQTRSCAGWRTAGDSFPRVLTARNSRQPRRGWLSLMRRHFRVGHLGRALHSRQVKRSTDVLGTIQPSPLPSPLKQERDLVTNYHQLRGHDPLVLAVLFLRDHTRLLSSLTAITTCYGFKPSDYSHAILDTAAAIICSRKQTWKLVWDGN